MSRPIGETSRVLFHDAPEERSTATPQTISLAPLGSWRMLQAFLDLVTVFAAASVGYAVYLMLGLGARHYAPLLYLKLCLGVAVVVVLFLQGVGAYRNQMGVFRIEAIRLVLLAVFWAFLAYVVLLYLIRIPGLSRLALLTQAALTVAALVTQRVLLWSSQERFRWFGRVSRPVLIYGAGDTGKLLARRLLEEHPTGLEPVGFIDDDESLLGQRVTVGRGVGGATLPVLGAEEDLFAKAEAMGAVALFLAIPSAPLERIEELVARVESREIPYYCVPSAGKLLLAGQKFGQLAGIPMFTRRHPSSDRLYAAAKRTVDVLVALTSLVVALPVLAVSAMLIKLTSPGPLFFIQERVGEGGKLFTIYKLRTMHQHAPKYARHPESKDDDRVSGVGRWLRRFSIDELPQLFNILRGDMSCVGPRPEMPFVVNRYNFVQRQRLTVKPGLSGLWQISEDRAFSIEANIQYDLYYVEHRCLSLDLAIMAMTPFTVLAKYGAK